MNILDVTERSMVPSEHFHEEEIAPGVTFRRLYPGGMAGPNRECYWDTPGGQQFSEAVMLGQEGDDVIMCLPDIRLPPNQILPMHSASPPVLRRGRSIGLAEVLLNARKFCHLTSGFCRVSSKVGPPVAGPLYR